MNTQTLQSGAIVRPLVPPTTSKPSSCAKTHREDDELVVLKSKVSLNDIVSKQRIAKCVKSTRCNHYECFDFESFCHINGVVPTFFSKPVLRDHELRYCVKDLPNQDGSRRFKLELKPRKDYHSITSLKLTRKTKQVLNFKCPLCNIDFNSTELIHDDFMTVLMRKVGMGVSTVELDDDGVCTILDATPVDQIQEVISLSEEDDDQQLSGKSKRRKVMLFSDDDAYDVTDSDISELENYVDGTENDPVVID